VGVLTEGQDERLTIDELARRTGMTVRNIRAHQSRGLLPPPEIEGRTGFYGPTHVARLQLISEMQADGFNLAAIKRLLQDSEGAESEVLGFRRALMAPWENEEPELLTNEELLARLKLEAPNPKLFERAIRSGFAVDLGEGRVEIPSPTLFRAAEELRDLGVPVEAALDVLDQIDRSSRSISRTFVQLFLDQIWRPFAASGHPEDEWPRVQAALERMRPLATDAVMAVFRRTMTEGVEKRFGEELERRAEHASTRRPRAPRAPRTRSGRSRG
jgi:DNA-binding transcriptional MerR regulator